MPAGAASTAALRVTLDAGVLPAAAAGPERLITQLVRALDDDGVRLTLRAATWRRAGTARAGLARIAPSHRRVVPRVPPRITSLLRWPPERLLGGRYDVFHQAHLDADPTVPGRRLVVSLNDLVALDWPGAEGYWGPYATRVLRRAARVVAISEATRAAAVDRLGLAPERITVMPLGVDHARFCPAAVTTDAPPTLLYVGGSTPRKNLDRLLAAVRLLRTDAATHDVRLLLIGPVGRAEQRLRGAAQAMGLPAGALRFAGAVDDEALAQAYRAAAVLVSPSLAEGFGLPVLEAMACGTPVVTSDRGAQREVAGGAARLVDPADVSAIAAGIAEVLGESEMQRAARVARGVARAAEFSWARSATILRGVYATVAGSA